MLPYGLGRLAFASGNSIIEYYSTIQSVTSNPMSDRESDGSDDDRDADDEYILITFDSF